MRLSLPDPDPASDATREKQIPSRQTDPLAGIHNDYETIAQAVRRVAYLLNVPHAITPGYPADDRDGFAIQF